MLFFMFIRVSNIDDFPAKMLDAVIYGTTCTSLVFCIYWFLSDFFSRFFCIKNRNIT